MSHSYVQVTKQELKCTSKAKTNKQQQKKEDEEKKSHACHSDLSLHSDMASGVSFTSTVSHELQAVVY